MALADMILSIVALCLYVVMLAQFTYRFLRSGWRVYIFIMLFALIRIAAFGIRAYLDSNPTSLSVNTYTNLVITELILLSVGVVFILKLLVKLYGFLLPKLRAQESEDPDLFERLVIEKTKFFLLPLIILVIVGAIYSTPSHTQSEQDLGLVLRKVGICLLTLLGFWYLFAAVTYRQRYASNSRQAFTIALIATALFQVSLIYKLIYTFYADAQNSTVAYFLFTPVLEIVALGFLCVDLQALFRGSSDGSYYSNSSDVETVLPAPAANSPYQGQNAGYYELQQQQQQHHNQQQY
ncbi:hypothetical protein BGX33_001949 [Mortierella sp. NVP41]|nr:hypothetical protein BGX33_001949 [Mortierella sp. NVP41]